MGIIVSLLANKTVLKAPTRKSSLRPHVTHPLFFHVISVLSCHVKFVLNLNTDDLYDVSFQLKLNIEKGNSHKQNGVL